MLTKRNQVRLISYSMMSLEGEHGVMTSIGETYAASGRGAISIWVRFRAN